MNFAFIEKGANGPTRISHRDPLLFWLFERVCTPPSSPGGGRGIEQVFIESGLQTLATINGTWPLTLLENYRQLRGGSADQSFSDGQAAWVVNKMCFEMMSTRNAKQINISRAIEWMVHGLGWSGIYLKATLIDGQVWVESTPRMVLDHNVEVLVPLPDLTQPDPALWVEDATAKFFAGLDP